MLFANASDEHLEQKHLCSSDTYLVNEGLGNDLYDLRFVLAFSACLQERHSQHLLQFGSIAIIETIAYEE